MRKQKILSWALGILAAVILVFFLLNLYVKNRLISELSQLENKVEYDEVEVNVLTNNFSLSRVQLRENTLLVKAEKVKISGLSYFQFLSQDEIHMKRVVIEEPQILLFPQDSSSNDTSQNRQISIGSLRLKNGIFVRKDSDTAEIDLYVRFPEMELNGISTAKKIYPEAYHARLDSVYIKLNAEHFIDIGAAEARDGRVNMKDFRIEPYDSKAEFDRKLPYEKDRISLKVEDILFENLRLEEQSDTLLLRESKMTISNAFLEIYRNKLLQDDERRKPLYNELLRQAPIKLDFKLVLVQNSEIIYEELVQEGRDAAVIRFTDVSAAINHLNNLPTNEQNPEITAKANFMRGTPVQLSWTFPVFEKANNFTISGGFGALEGAALDPFLIPALDVQARGSINAISFNFTGNEEQMTGNFSLDYDELEVELLKEEGTEQRSFWSAIANLFVKNEAEPEPEDEFITVERNKQRSFWNYVWLGLREGLMQTVSRL